MLNRPDHCAHVARYFRERRAAAVANFYLTLASTKESRQ
jgi:hypothetical protein